MNNKQERDLSEAGIIEWLEEPPEIIFHMKGGYFSIQKEVNSVIDARDWTAEYARKYAMALGGSVTLASYLSGIHNNNDGEAFFCAYVACRTYPKGNIRDIADYGISGYMRYDRSLPDKTKELFTGDKKSYESILARASNTLEDLRLIRPRLVVPKAKNQLEELRADLKNQLEEFYKTDIKSVRKIDGTRQAIWALEGFLMKYDQNFK
jgi:hypothetical protein